jgi:hypothetical protein
VFRVALVVIRQALAAPSPHVPLVQRANFRLQLAAVFHRRVPIVMPAISVAQPHLAALSVRRVRIQLLVPRCALHAPVASSSLQCPHVRRAQQALTRPATRRAQAAPRASTRPATLRALIVPTASSKWLQLKQHVCPVALVVTSQALVVPSLHALLVELASFRLELVAVFHRLG